MACDLLRAENHRRWTRHKHTRCFRLSLLRKESSELDKAVASANAGKEGVSLDRLVPAILGTRTRSARAQRRWPAGTRLACALRPISSLTVVGVHCHRFYERLGTPLQEGVQPGCSAPVPCCLRRAFSAQVASPHALPLAFYVGARSSRGSHLCSVCSASSILSVSPAYALVAVLYSTIGNRRTP